MIRNDKESDYCLLRVWQAEAPAPCLDRCGGLPVLNDDPSAGHGPPRVLAATGGSESWSATRRGQARPRLVVPGEAVRAAHFRGVADSTREREAGARPPGDAESAAVADAVAPAEVLNLGYCPSRRAQSASLLLVVRGNGFHQPCSLSLGAAMAARPVRLLIREHIVFGSQAALFCTCVDGYGRSGNRGSNFAQGWREPRGTKRHHLASESVQFHARLASASALLRSEAPLARSSFKRSHGAWAVCRPPFQHEVTSVPTGLPSTRPAVHSARRGAVLISPVRSIRKAPPLLQADWPSAVPLLLSSCVPHLT